MGKENMGWKILLLIGLYPKSVHYWINSDSKELGSMKQMSVYTALSHSKIHQWFQRLRKHAKSSQTQSLKKFGYIRWQWNFKYLKKVI